MNESKKKDRYEDAKKFVRYSDGAKMYSMGMTKFQEVAKDAKACYKIGQLVLVNTEILDKYLETFVHVKDTSAEVLRAAMLQKGFDLILVPSIGEAKRRIFEDKEIELILCDLELPDGTAMELFHTLRRVAGMFQMKNPPVRLLPFFILTENNDLATEYEYRHEGVNDYITAPVNIPELIRRVLFFVE